MPPPLAQLQAALRRRERQQGDRAMAKVLAAVPVHGLEAVLQAVKQMPDAGAASIEQVANLLSRPIPARVETTLKLIGEPLPDTARYDSLPKWIGCRSTSLPR